MELMKIRYSLERHLHDMADANKRIQSLESVYIIQKEKMEHFLSSIKTTFPTYSIHDAYHSDNIIIAIEELLGENRIHMLSGADTFLLLICAYMHDLGMLYTDEEVRNLWGSVEFKSFLHSCINGNTSLKEAAIMVNEKWKKEKSEVWALDIKKSIGLLLMEFFRSKHGERIEKITDKKYGIISELIRFDISFIPERISRLIYKISMAHNWNLDKLISDLPYQDTFNGEKMHPRFIAFLLRLGDLCDLDNNRFDRVSIATFGILDDDNLSHYFKHKSVNTLNISEDIIYINVDIREDDIDDECRYDWMKDETDFVRKKRVGNVFRATVKEHIFWRSWMEDEFNFGRLNCKKIFPSSMPMNLPQFEYKILINGEDSASAKENLRFNFSAEKAFSLIENISIYQDEKFIFVRELVQNAIDATKLQFWRDLQSKGIEHLEDLSPFEVERKSPDIYDQYPIKITADYDHARKIIQIKVSDCGIGISVDEFKNNILVTGNSWRKRAAYREELNAMPKWLCPTGAFGIGLHTVFYKTDQLEIHTKSESEKYANKITLYSGKKDGFAFCQKDISRKKRGSEFIFEYKLDEDEEKSLLNVDEGMEIFGKFEEKFISLIINEVENWCEKPLFPIYVNEECIASCMTKSEHSCILSDEENVNFVLSNYIEDKKYEYAFSEDCKNIAVWDKMNGIFINTVIFNDDYDINTSFMGIKLNNGFRKGDKGIPLLGVNDIDILVGTADMVIDASRTKLKSMEQERLQPIVYEVLCFARNKYIEFLKIIIEDKERVEMFADLEKLLDIYSTGNLTADKLILNIYKLEKKFFVSDGIKNLERKTLVYKLAYILVDMQLLKDYYSLWNECTNNKDSFEWVDKVDFLGLFDIIIKHQKSCGKKGFDCEFNDDYFNINIKNIIHAYMEKWGCLIAICYHKQNITKEGLNDLQKLINETINRKMPFLRKWKIYRDYGDYVVSIIDDYCSKSANGSVTNLIKRLIEPTTLHCFEDWEYCGVYAPNKALPLSICGWYRNIIFMMLDGEQDIDKQSVDLWKRTLTNTIYGNVSCNPRELDCNINLLDNLNFIQKSDQLIIDNELSEFLEYMPIDSIEFSSGHWSVTYHIGKVPTDKAGNIEGYEANCKTRDAVYVKYYDRIKLCDTNDTEYEAICGFAKFDKILLFKENFTFNQILNKNEHWGRYIPLWECNGRINSFIAEHLDMDYFDWANLVREDKQFIRVTKYICWKKYNSYDNKKLEEIQEQYKEFLLEMFGAWYENINGTRAIG